MAQNEYILAFNGTTTKAIFVKQPLFENTALEEEDVTEKDGKDSNLFESMLRKKLCLSKPSLEKATINVYMMCKKQNIIINLIP